MRVALFFAFITIISYHSPLIQGTYCDYGKEKFNPNRPFQLLSLHCTSSGKIYFYLEAGRGKPNYNSGAMYKELTFNSKTRNYEYLPSDITQDCKLVFIKKGNCIIIKTASGECQFGYGVSADGIYLLRDTHNPQYFVDRHDHKVYFDKTTPEKYLE